MAATVCERRGTTSATFTVRKVSDGVGVERIFPLTSPFIDRVELITQGRVRRSRLYYLRALKGKAARIKPRGSEARGLQVGNNQGGCRHRHRLSG